MIRSNPHFGFPRLPRRPGSASLLSLAVAGLTAAALLLVAAPQTARAQTNVVAPNALANTEGSDLNPLLTSNAQRTYQTQIAASELKAFQIGDQIGGISFRLDNGAAAYPSDLTYTNYQVTLSQAKNPIGSFSTTFANNIGANAALVYDTGLTFAKSSFSNLTSGTTPEAFGPTITFSSAYTYQGDDLVITLRHSAGTVGSTFLDATTSPQTQNTTLVAIGANSSSVTTGFSTPAIVLRLNGVTGAAGPEPGTFPLLGMGLVTGAGMVGGVRRRKAKSQTAKQAA